MFLFLNLIAKTLSFSATGVIHLVAECLSGWTTSALLVQAQRLAHLIVSLLGLFIVI